MGGRWMWSRRRSILIIYKTKNYYIMLPNPAIMRTRSPPSPYWQRRLNAAHVYRFWREFLCLSHNSRIIVLKSLIIMKTLWIIFVCLESPRNQKAISKKAKSCFWLSSIYKWIKRESIKEPVQRSCFKDLAKSSLVNLLFDEIYNVSKRKNYQKWNCCYYCS